MFGRRAQVLSERQDVDADLAQLAEHRAQLVGLFAQAQHQPGLGDRAARLRVAQDRVRTGVARLHAHLARQPRHRLEVVREHVGAGGQHDVDRAGVALEVAGQHLQHHVGADPLHGADRRRPVRGAAVGQVVPIDAGDHGVAQPELAQHGGDVFRLVRVGRQRPAGRDVAELARPGADAAQDHDRQRLPVPALADVRARRALAHGVQPELRDPFLEVEEDVAARHLHPDPGRLRLQRRARLGGDAGLGLQDAEAARAGFDDAGCHGTG